MTAPRRRRSFGLRTLLEVVLVVAAVDRAFEMLRLRRTIDRL
jgi:hypothetical protein